LIQLHQLRKRYPGADRDALSDVTFSLGPGDFAFLCGGSGAGKTSLLRILVGLERPTAGQVLVDGRNLARIRGGDLCALRRRIGFVFQDFRLLPERTALENVELPLLATGVSATKARARATEQLERFEVIDRASAFARCLSAGEQQRVAIARALVGAPALLLADEPTGNLDPSLTAHVMSLLVDAQAGGTAVLVATHDPAVVAGLARPVLRLDNGSVREPPPRPANGPAMMDATG